MTKLKTPRIGPKMEAAVGFVAVNPGCPKIEPAFHVSPHPEQGKRRCGLQFGYEVIKRCVRAGLIDEGQLTGRGYALQLTDKGQELVRSWDD